MPKSYATQQLIIAKEDTYGVATTPAWKKLNAFRWDPQTTFETDPFMASGDTAASIIVVNDDFTEGDVEGRSDYNGNVYLLSSIFGPATITTPMGATNARQWVFEWDGRTPLIPVSYLGSYGEPGVGNADEVPGMVFNSFGISGGRGGFELSSAVLAKALIAGQELARGAVPTEVEPVPVFPLHGDIFLDPTWLGLGTTKLLEIYELGIDVADRTARTRPINSLRSSDAIIESSEQEHTVALKFGVDPVERARFSKIRTGVKEFVRARFVGPEIEAGFNYLMQFDFCLGWTEVGASEDTDSVLTREWTGMIMRDSVSGLACRVTVVNAITGL